MIIYFPVMLCCLLVQVTGFFTVCKMELTLRIKEASAAVMVRTCIFKIPLSNLAIFIIHLA